MKVRIKEYADGRNIRYEVQYKVYGLFWRKFDWHSSIEDAIKDAKKLMACNFPRYMTLKEAEAKAEMENKEQQ